MAWRQRPMTPGSRLSPRMLCDSSTGTPWKRPATVAPRAAARTRSQPRTQIATTQSAPSAQTATSAGVSSALMSIPAVSVEATRNGVNASAVSTLELSGIRGR